MVSLAGLGALAAGSAEVGWVAESVAETAAREETTAGLGALAAGSAEVGWVAESVAETAVAAKGAEMAVETVGAAKGAEMAVEMEVGVTGVEMEVMVELAVQGVDMVAVAEKKAVAAGLAVAAVATGLAVVVDHTANRSTKAFDRSRSRCHTALKGIGMHLFPSLLACTVDDRQRRIAGQRSAVSFGCRRWRLVGCRHSSARVPSSKLVCR